MTHQTPLYQQHLDFGAAMTTFQNWSLPLNFGSQIDEHLAVRRCAGMFDVSHMVITDLKGEQVLGLLQLLLANNIEKLKVPGKAFYSLMLNESGGIIDDLIVYFLGPCTYRMVSNAGTRERVTRWLQVHAEKYDCACQIRDDLAMIAIQGPKAIATVNLLLPKPPDFISYENLKPFQACQVGDWLIAATGYTGELGLEIMLPANDVQKLWQDCFDAGIVPCGLGARDTLRLEAGFCLYGQDMDENVSPAACHLNWTVSLQPPTRTFIGKEAWLAAQRDCQQSLIGLVLETRGVLRMQMPVYAVAQEDATEVGVITSGSFSPSLGCSIALARVNQPCAQTLFVKLRQGWCPVRVTEPVFFRRGQALI